MRDLIDVIAVGESQHQRQPCPPLRREGGRAVEKGQRGDLAGIREGRHGGDLAGRHHWRLPERVQRGSLSHGAKRTTRCRAGRRSGQVQMNGDETLVKVLGVPVEPLDDLQPPRADVVRVRPLRQQAFELGINLGAVLRSRLLGLAAPRRARARTSGR